MLSVTNSNPLPIQATLVATALPDTSTLRVAADTVSPSVSTALVEQDASGNNTNALTSGDIASSSGSSQAAFLAQLISQEVPPPLQTGVRSGLVQYEQTVVNSYIKYKPSNAGIPPISSGASDEVSAAVQVPVAEPVAAPVVSTPEPQVSTPQISTQAEATVNTATTPVATPVVTLPLPLPQAVSAYSQTVANSNAYAAANSNTDLPSENNVAV